jgi:hypothetical protein
MGFNLHVPLPGPISYNKRLSGGGCGLFLIFAAVIVIVTWVMDHWWVLLLVPGVMGWLWLAERNDARLARAEHSDPDER